MRAIRKQAGAMLGPERAGLPEAQHARTDHFSPETTNKQEVVKITIGVALLVEPKIPESFHLGLCPVNSQRHGVLFRRRCRGPWYYKIDEEPLTLSTMCAI